MTKTKLIRLENGSWIDPKIVTSIRLVNGNVIVHTNDGVEVIECNNFEDAKTKASQIAEVINNSTTKTND